VLLVIVVEVGGRVVEVELVPAGSCEPQAAATRMTTANSSLFTLL
jgi:hypothetical protein